MIRTIFMAILLLSCTATTVYASMFELETVAISKIKDDPTVYDSTMAYRKISVIGNLSELSKQSAILTDNNDSLKINKAKMELFEGFNISEQVLMTGEFTYDPLEDGTFTPTYVLRYPTIDMGIVNISEINADQLYHNGKYVTVVGNLSKMEMTMGRYTAVIEDDEGNSMKVFYYGATELKTGDIAKVYGLYNGRIIHSENMAMNKSPLSLSTLVPGFSSVLGALAILSIALLLRSKERND